MRRRQIEFLGFHIVALPSRPARCSKVIFWGHTIALLGNGKIGWGGAQRRIRFGRIDDHSGVILAEGMLRLGAITQKTHDEFAKAAQAREAERDAKDAVAEIEDLAKRIGITLTARQLRKIRAAR